MCRGDFFFLKINKRADQNKAVQGGFVLSKLINVQENKNTLNVQGEFFLKNNKCADQNKAVQGGIFFSKLINMQDKYQYTCRMK